MLLVSAAGLAGCKLGPQVPDTPGLGTNILPPGATVTSIADNQDLIAQIQLNDGLSDSALAMTNGVVTRSPGKSNGAAVMYWNFGAAPIESGIAVAAPLYILADDNGDGTFTPLPDQLALIDTICGDVRYSPIRRVQYVPVTDKYNGELLTTMDALGDAMTLGLVGEPVSAGTWVNMPVVLPGTMLEVSATAPPAPTTQVYAHGYLVDVFKIGWSVGQQPVRNGFVPIGQAASLQSGVPMGTPPTLSTAFDPQPVFQFAIPTAPPAAGMPNYTPLTTEVDVRLATNIAPTMITNDTQLFKRSASGSISAYYTDNVASFTITTTVTNRPIQFADGAP
jgi:hypothetical protein